MGTGIESSGTSKVKLPDFSFEKKIWKRGFGIIGGMDEVGRGCFAGPIVAGAVVFSPDTKLQFPLSDQKNKRVIINDSKKLTSGQREITSAWIKKNALAWGIGEASVAMINRVGLSQATKVAFRRSITNTRLRLSKQNIKLEFILIDAFFIPRVTGLPKMKGKRLLGSRNFNDGFAALDSKARQLAIIGGDAKSVSIAAASIIAKVYRDNLMTSIGLKRRYKKYLWPKNKGYASLGHREAILKYGVTRYHRTQFLKTFLTNVNKQP